MGTVTIHQRRFDVDCIVFDKDGTLIELNALWGPRTERWVEAIAAKSGMTAKERKRLYALLGYSPEAESVRPESPLAVASCETLYTLAAGEICQAGIPWHQARSQAIACAQDTISAAFDPAEIRPKGDVAGILRKLTQAQIHIAVITSDDRRMTEATLELLEVKEMVSPSFVAMTPFPTNLLPRRSGRLQPNLASKQNES